MINLFQPDVGDAELTSLHKVFASNWLGRGDKAKEFELGLSKFLGVGPNQVTTVGSCSDGMRILFECLANQMGLGKKALIPVNSFPVLASSAILSGFEVIFCDIDPRTGNISIDQLIKQSHKDIKVICVTDYGGNPVDIDSLREVYEEAFIICDSACSLGSFYDDGRAVGVNADATLWSFDAMKLVIAGEGGAIHTKDSDLLEEFKRRAYLGLPVGTKSGLGTAEKGGRWWEYNVEVPAYRSIFTDVSAAIGNIQLSKIRKKLEIKRLARLKYEKSLQVDILENSLNNHANYFCTICVEARDELAFFLKQKGVYTSLRYWRLDKTNLKNYAQMCESTLGADYFYSRCLNIPIHSELKSSEVDYIIDSVNEFVNKR